MALEAETALRNRLWKAGFAPIPVQGKIPVHKAWQKLETNAEDIGMWAKVFEHAANTGILTRVTPAIDIDIKIPEAAQAVEELARERFEEHGFFLVRIGEAPKRAILLRTDKPFNKIAVSLTAPNGASEKIELLGDGQQVVVAGIHPGTGRPYSWHGGEPGAIVWEDLPYVSQETAQAFVTEAAKLLVDQFGYVAAAARPKIINGADGGTSADWAYLLDCIHRGHELHDSSVALAAKLVSSGMNDGAAVNFLRAAFEAAAIPHDQRWQDRYNDIPRDVSSARSKFGPRAEDKSEPAKLLLRATPYPFPDPRTMPPRKWIHAGHYVCGAATATVAPGGFGKTTLALFETISMALTGYRVWYISGEDQREEIDRRIAAHLQHHKIDPEQIKGRLFVDDKTSFPLFFGTAKAAKVEFDEAWLRCFEEAIGFDQIDVVLLDPFISFHSVPEGDNGAIDQIIKRLASICFTRKICIEINHHVRKANFGQTELTVDDARGASALVNAVRSSRVINRMSDREADLARIGKDKRAFHLRLDKGKRNMAPPEAATWFRLVSVPLPNGDNVQALEAWSFPSAFAGMTDADVIWVQELLLKKPLRASSQSDEWLGHYLGARFGRDTHEKEGAIWANKIIGQWLRNGVFKKDWLRDPNSRKTNVPFYVSVAHDGSHAIADTHHDDD